MQIRCDVQQLRADAVRKRLRYELGSPHVLECANVRVVAGERVLDCPDPDERVGPIGIDLPGDERPVPRPPRSAQLGAPRIGLGRIAAFWVGGGHLALRRSVVLAYIVCRTALWRAARSSS